MVPEKEIQGIEVRGAWRLSNRPAESNPLPWKCSVEVIMITIEKCIGVPSYMNPTFRCVMAGTNCSNSGRSGKFAYAQVSSTLPRCSKYLHSPLPSSDSAFSLRENAMANAFWVSVRNNISKRWNTTENDVSKNQSSADSEIRLPNTSILNSNAADITEYFLDVPNTTLY
ncbi:hypothetical protein TNCV_3005251 [Trichonephila clavipes]|nr:hypothetical protein TNCV_3005251 [Trichonephila clavipes]